MLKFKSVQNMTSSRGNLVPNQFIVNLIDSQGREVEFFQSYKTVIAQKVGGVITLDSNALEYSNTTLKYLKEFLNTSCSKKDLYKRIDEGKYLVQDLNK